MEAGRVLARFRAAQVLLAPTYLTVQISETEHILRLARAERLLHKD